MALGAHQYTFLLAVPAGQGSFRLMYARVNVTCWSQRRSKFNCINLYNSISSHQAADRGQDQSTSGALRAHRWLGGLNSGQDQNGKISLLGACGVFENQKLSAGSTKLAKI